MEWKCPTCGHQNDDHHAPCQAMCGYVRFGRLVLVAATGQETRVNIDTSVGKSLLRRLVGDDARFASEPQFHLRRSEEHGAWMVVPDAKAVNATYVNGAKVDGDGVRVVSGSEITVGADKARVKVRVQT